MKPFKQCSQTSIPLSEEQRRYLQTINYHPFGAISSNTYEQLLSRIEDQDQLENECNAPVGAPTLFPSKAGSPNPNRPTKNMNKKRRRSLLKLLEQWYILRILPYLSEDMDELADETSRQKPPQHRPIRFF